MSEEEPKIINECDVYKCTEGPIQLWCCKCPGYFTANGITHHKECGNNCRDGVDYCPTHRKNLFYSGYGSYVYIEPEKNKKC